MQLFNNALYDAVQNSALVYTLTIQAGREAIPADSVGIVMSLRDDSGKSARVLMDSSGNAFTVVRIFSTTENDNTMPTFGAGLVAFSSDVAEALEIPFLSAGLAWSGQSNGQGWNNGKGALDRTRFYEFDNRIKQSTWHESPTRRTEKKCYAVEPLFHPSESPEGANALCPAIPFAYQLLDEGWREVCILPNCIPGSPISFFDTGTDGYNDLVGSIVEFINDSPNNRLACWVHQQGETDQTNDVTPDQFRDALIDLHSRVNAAVLAQTGVDISRVPFLAVGMGASYRANQFYYDQIIDMEQGIADSENYIPYSAYVEIPTNYQCSESGAETGDRANDLVHLSAWGVYKLATFLMPPKLEQARMNYAPSALATDLILNATAPNLALSGSTASLYTNEPVVLNATAPNLTLSGSSPTLYLGRVIALNATAANLPLSGSSASLLLDKEILLSATAPNLALSGSTAQLVTPDQAPDLTNTLSYSPAIVIRSDYGVTVDGSGNVTQVDDLSTNGLHLTPGVGATGNVTVSGGALVFEAGAALKNDTGSLPYTPTPATFIIEFYADPSSTAYVFNESKDTVGYGTALHVKNNNGSIKNGTLTNLFTLSGVNLDDGSNHVIAGTINSSNNLALYAGTRAGGVTYNTNQSGNKGNPAAYTPQTILGAQNESGANGFVGGIFRYVTVQGTALTEAQINEIIAEF